MLVLILGMHRSGTSCLAGSLRSCGLPFGEVNERAGFNLKGNQEHVPIVQLHDFFLKQRGGAWDKPPETVTRWSDEEADNIEASVNLLRGSAGSTGLVGLKDPRTLLFMRNWDAYRTIKVGTYRHPASVISSLCNRANAWGQAMSESQALALWCRYNRALLSAYDRLAFPIIAYDQAVEDYNVQVKYMAQYIGLDAPENPNFRDAALTHYESKSRLTGEALEIWNRLESIRFDRVKAA